MTVTPRPPADLAILFTYHPPTPEQPPVYELVRDLTHHLALVLGLVSVRGPEYRAAVGRLEEAVMLANAGIARHGLADAGTQPPAQVLQIATDQLRESKPDSAVVSYCPAGWHGHDDVPRETNPAHLTRALEVIALSGCENSTHAQGCLAPGSRRYAGAAFGDERVCDPCVARAALEGRLLPTMEHPA